jgi:hypothetical protein
VTNAACSIAVGNLAVHPAAVSSTGNVLACTGTVDGHALNCGSGMATLEKKSCTDGFAYVLSSGDAKLQIRVKAGSTWQAGAQFDGSDPLTGDITFSHLPMPGETAPEAGSQQNAEFVIMGTTNGQGIVGHGNLSATW